MVDSVSSVSTTASAYAASSSSSSVSLTSDEMKDQLISLGIPEDVISEGESAIREYAYDNNITLPDTSTTQTSVEDTETEENLFDI